MQNATPPGDQETRQPRRRLRRIIAYLLSTKILVGGILGFVATQTVDAYKIHRTESREDVIAVTEKVTDLIKDLPENSVGIAAVIRRVENLFIAFRSPPAREYISGVIGQLAARKAAYEEQELRARQAAEAVRIAKEAKALSEAIAKAAEDARISRAREAARLEAEAKAAAEANALAQERARIQSAEAEEARRRAAREAREYIDQAKWDRRPK